MVRVKDSAEVMIPVVGLTINIEPRSGRWQQQHCRMASLDGIEAEDVISEAAGSGCKGIIKVKGGRWQGRVSGIIKGKYIYVPGTFKDLNDAVEARAKFVAELKAGTREVPVLKPPKPREHPKGECSLLTLSVCASNHVVLYSLCCRAS